MALELIEKKSITLAGAKTLVDAATAKARELGIAVTVAVVDEAGTLKTLHRMDGAPAPTVDVALAKARTAAQWGAPTSLWRDLGREDNGLLIGFLGALGQAGLWAGGNPINVKNALVGGIASSGGSEEQDSEVVSAALAAAGA